MDIKLNDTWHTQELIGSGGFGRVYRATNTQGQLGAIKLIPKQNGATRDLLVADLSGVGNIIPIIDQGETDDDWVLAMPLAEGSLRDQLTQSASLTLSDVVKLAKDIATSLKDLDGRVVHRDIKPENVLLLDGQWCLSDFGISRYAEATTAPDTQKFSLSPPYAAPERWQSIRATTATDMYSLGVLIYESLMGDLPFKGPSTEDFREQHIHHTPARMEGVPTAFVDLVEECLYKAPASRPSPSSFLDRIDRSVVATQGGGLGALQQANRQQVQKQIENQASTTREDEVAKRRSELEITAKQEFDRISTRLKEAIVGYAPSANLTASQGQEWRIKLGDATLDLNEFQTHAKDDWGGWDAPAMDVIAYASIDVAARVNRLGYEGRGHSLWYCDAQKRGEFGWYEVAFMVSALIPRSMMGTNGGIRDPFQLNPGEESAKALWRGMAEFQLARPFILLKDTAVEQFIDQWAGYLASASTSALNRPSTMPEMTPNGSWQY